MPDGTAITVVAIRLCHHTADPGIEQVQHSVAAYLVDTLVLLDEPQSVCDGAGLALVLRCARFGYGVNPLLDLFAADRVDFAADEVPRRDRLPALAQPPDLLGRPLLAVVILLI